MTASRWNAGQSEGNGQYEGLSTSSTASTHVMSLPQVLAKGQAFFSKLSRASGYTLYSLTSQVVIRGSRCSDWRCNGWQPSAWGIITHEE